MARKEKIIKIEDRGQELTFKIKEMSAIQLESWIMRVLLLLASAGVEVPDGANLQSVGQYLVKKGPSILGGLDYDKAKPLLDELLACCSRVIDRVEEKCTPESVDGYIQDVKTIFTLRAEAIKLNLGFLAPEGENL